MSDQKSHSTWSNFTTQRSLRGAFDVAANGGFFVVVKGGTLNGVYPVTGAAPLETPCDSANIRMVFRGAAKDDTSVATLDLRDGLFPRDVYTALIEKGAGYAKPVVTITDGKRSCVVAAGFGNDESVRVVRYSDYRVSLVTHPGNERGLNA